MNALWKGKTARTIVINIWLMPGFLLAVLLLLKILHVEKTLLDRIPKANRMKTIHNRGPSVMFKNSSITFQLSPDVSGMSEVN